MVEIRTSGRTERLKHQLNSPRGEIIGWFTPAQKKHAAAGLLMVVSLPLAVRLALARDQKSSVKLNTDPVPAEVVPSRYPNPSPYEVFSFLQAEAAAYGVPWEWASSVAMWESSLRNFSWEKGFPPFVNVGSSSTDWGMFAINDYYHPDLVNLPGVKTDWRENARAGLTLMAECINRFSPVNDSDLTWLDCYGGFGKNYADYVRKVYESRFWVGDQPLLPPLPAGFVVTETDHWGGGNYYHGWDLAWCENPDIYPWPAPVISPLTGSVMEDYTDEYGNSVLTIQSDAGYRVRLLHLKKHPDVWQNQGNRVFAGQIVGEMSDIGYTSKDANASGLHLHVDYNGPDGAPLNPGDWLFQLPGYWTPDCNTVWGDYK